ncbi:POT family protein [Xylariaceae sp. FL0594]|nr:POT family protein [Xylariaceae sp. FL0594]
MYRPATSDVVMATHGVGAENTVGLTVRDVVEPAAIPEITQLRTEGVHTVESRETDHKLVASLESDSNDFIDYEAYPPPTQEEQSTLRKIADSVPWTAWTLCFVELAERASYYGAKAVFSNYLQFPLPKGGDGTGAVDPNKPESHAGALGLGIQTASALGLLFTFLAYVIPIFGAWWADTRIGRYRAIVVGVVIGAVAHVVMRYVQPEWFSTHPKLKTDTVSNIGGAAPAILAAGRGVAPFLISFFLLALGAGIFKPNVAPTLMDQYQHQRQYTRVLKSGEKVIVDPEVTINHIFLLFYGFVNAGAFFAIAVVYIEKYRGFWLAFLAPGILYFLLPVLLAAMHKRIIRKKPEGSDLTRFTKITISALKKSKGRIFAKDFWEKVKPSTLARSGTAVSYSEKDVSDAQRTWEVVQIFLYLPIWYINDGGVGSLPSSQGAAMTNNGVPNDLLSHFNPLVIIVVSPFMAQVVNPYLTRKNIKFGRITRMTFGFVLAILSAVFGAVVQYYVYKTSPCGYQATNCEQVSPVSIWWQIPNVALGAISEVFVNVTAYELAYARAPEHMRATVIALFLFMTALSSALGEILVPAITDPTLIWAWAAPGIALAAQTVVFWFRHRHVNDDVFMTYKEDFVEQEQESERKEDGDGDGDVVGEKV